MTPVMMIFFNIEFKILNPSNLKRRKLTCIKKRKKKKKYIGFGTVKFPVFQIVIPRQDTFIRKSSHYWKSVDIIRFLCNFRETELCFLNALSGEPFLSNCLSLLQYWANSGHRKSHLPIQFICANNLMYEC